MDYNTQREKILLPEYGRTVQRMVEYAMTLGDKAQRQRCAETIVKVMGNFNPQNRNVPMYRQKLWDHLAMLSNYKLDIDYPYPVNKKAADAKPERVPYPMTKIKYRHYGHLIESLLKKLADMPEGEEKEELTRLVEGQMRRSLEAWNKDALSRGKIAKDINAYTR